MALLDIKPKKATEDFIHLYAQINEIGIAKAESLIQQALAYYKSSDRELPPYQEFLERKWYKSLRDGSPDYSVYGHKYYFTDVWTCWILYSRTYLRAIKKHNSFKDDQSIYDYIGDIKSVLDMGCGIGYTTAALSEIFEGAKVYGTNLKGTLQWEFCSMMAKWYGFNLVQSAEEVNRQVDFVFASEYFEHIYEVIDHANEMLDAVDPKFLYIANAFNTRSVGHFSTYKIGGKLVDQSKAGRVFDYNLRNRGYKKLKTKLWNNRPTLWEKA